MQKIDFRPPEHSTEHKCTSSRSGDWILFTCPECPAYERRFNWRTAEMKVKGSRPDVHHTGFHSAKEYTGLFDPSGWRNLN